MIHIDVVVGMINWGMIIGKEMDPMDGNGARCAESWRVRWFIGHRRTDALYHWRHYHRPDWRRSVARQWHRHGDRGSQCDPLYDADIFGCQQQLRSAGFGAALRP